MEYYPREEYDYRISLKYSESMSMGAKFPPIVVAKIQGKYWLVDGMHRIKAYQHQKIENIQVEINQKIKDFNDLYVEAVKANLHHGRPLNENDKELIIEKLKELNYNNKEISALIHTPISKLKRINFKNFKTTTAVFGNKNRKSRKNQKEADEELKSNSQKEEDDDFVPSVINRNLKQYLVIKKDTDIKDKNYFLILSESDIDELKLIIHPTYEIKEETGSERHKRRQFERDNESQEKEKKANEYMEKHRKELDIQKPEPKLCIYCGKTCEDEMEMCEDCFYNMDKYKEQQATNNSNIIVK
jgi:hypothetical protein